MYDCPECCSFGDLPEEQKEFPRNILAGMPRTVRLPSQEGRFFWTADGCPCCGAVAFRAERAETLSPEEISKALVERAYHNLTGRGDFAGLSKQAIELACAVIG